MYKANETDLLFLVITRTYALHLHQSFIIDLFPPRDPLICEYQYRCMRVLISWAGAETITILHGLKNAKLSHTKLEEAIFGASKSSSDFQISVKAEDLQFMFFKLQLAIL